VLDYWTDRIEALLKACVRDRHVWGAKQSMDVMFHEFMVGDMATVEKIYVSMQGFLLNEVWLEK